MKGAASSIDRTGMGWPGALVLIMAGVVSAFHVGKPSAVLEVMRTDLGIGPAMAAWMVSAPGLVGALAGTVVGLVVERFGARSMVLLGLLAQACASAAGALAATPSALLGTRIAEGLGFQVVVVAAPALIATSVSGPSRTAAMAGWSTFMPVGLAAALLSAWLVPAGWKGLWWGGSALTLLAAAAVRACVPAPDAAAAAAGVRSLRADLGVTWRARGPVLLAVLFGLFNAVYFAVFAFLPLLLLQASQAVGASTLVLSAIAVGASAVGNLAGLALLTRGARPDRLLAFSFAALAACAVPIALEGGAVWLRLSASIAFGALAGLIPAALFAQVPARTPRPGLQGLVVGLMMQGGNIGLTAGPPLAGVAAAVFGWQAVIAVVALLAAIAIGMVRLLMRSQSNAATDRFSVATKTKPSSAAAGEGFQRRGTG